MAVSDPCIAFLILAHDQPKHLARLLRALEHDRHVFFIHIDAKSDLGMFERSVSRSATNVVFLKGNDRFRIHWGGFSIVKATLRLVEVARTYRKGFDRFVLLSGAYYPIMTVMELR
jgi:hypothetical protein